MCTRVCGSCRGILRSSRRPFRTITLNGIGTLAIFYVTDVLLINRARRIYNGDLCQRRYTTKISFVTLAVLWMTFTATALSQSQKRRLSATVIHDAKLALTFLP